MMFRIVVLVIQPFKAAEITLLVKHHRIEIIHSLSKVLFRGEVAVTLV